MRSLSKTLILILVVLFISQSLFLVMRTHSKVETLKEGIMEIEVSRPTAQASASGIVAMCINTAPQINLSNCSTSINQSDFYECWVNTSDPDYAALTYTRAFSFISRAFTNSTDALFNLTASGYFNFTPDNDDVGNYTVSFTVRDGYGCDNSLDTDTLSLTVINVNDPPYLITDIPDQSIGEGDVLHAFYLNNYFDDPDEDNLTYTVTGNTNFIVSISNTTSEVVISSSSCDITEYVLFTAIDPYNETNTSNLVSLTCVAEGETPPGDGEGGGGGGGSGRVIPCLPEYECYDYFKCRENNTKVQKCVDIHGCENDIFLTVPCKYHVDLVCNETWNCTEWTPCLPNGTQDRTCVDLNECGTQKFKPVLQQECEYIGTCDDGIKNCHDDGCEENIDCGGPCPVCPKVEVPYPIEEERSILIYIITGIILLILMAVLLYHYFRKEIDAALAKAGWIITRKRRKQLLLSIEDKRRLLAGITDLEKKIGKMELFDLLNKYGELIRDYMLRVCGKPLTPEFDLKELETVLHTEKKKIREILRKIFVSTFEKYKDIAQNKELITERNLILLAEELRNLVLQTSKVEPADLAREEKEIKIPAKISAREKFTIMISNTYIALEYLELEVAKKKYLEILVEYDQLKPDEQEALYKDVSRLYHNISYVNSWHGKVKV